MLRFLLVAALSLSACGSPPGCVTEGNGYDLKAMVEGPCCDGLLAANTSEPPDADGVCQVEDLNPAKVCIACGDGTCSEAENACNCAEDCG